MLIISEADASGGLLFTAYTFDTHEFQALERTLKHAGILPRATNIAPDAEGREGREYFVPADRKTPLGAIIGGRFAANGAFQPQPGGPKDSPANVSNCKESSLAV